MAYVVEVENLYKAFYVAERDPGVWGALRGLVRRRYRTIRALDGISFTLERGELVGYIGPNGAGKSTTVKVLAGILVPDGGRCKVMGRTPWRERVAHVAEIGVVFGQRTQLWWDLPVIESFDLLRDIYRVPRREYWMTRDALVERMGLGELLNTPVRQLSLGQRMRCDLAAALLHRPKLLFLDEPTIGLDAVSKLVMRDFVRRLNREEGVTVILTTHDMDDVEALCSRIILIHRGHILLDGTVEDLRRQVRGERCLTVDLEDAGQSIEDPDCQVVGRAGPRVQLRFDPSRVSAAELVHRIMARYSIRDLYVDSQPIEEIVARAYEEMSQQ
ncbi:MAG: ATP-binding cassette domain-containing protein [Chloroflexi bacterium]|nr:ATP-binding cassette domain-containing protein [Chloroflexota bacterium]